MELFDTVKQIVKDHHKGYQPYFISYPGYEEAGPVCRTSEEADRWLARQMMASRRADDWGYVNEVTLEDKIAA